MANGRRVGRWVAGCGLALVGFAVVSVAAGSFVVAGVQGVARRGLKVEVDVRGASLDPHLRMEESWYTVHPGSGGWISLWPGNETVPAHGRIEGSVIRVDAPTGSWCFFDQRFEALGIGAVRLYPSPPGEDTSCRRLGGSADLEVDLPPYGRPLCLAYDPATTRSIRVHVDATPANRVFGDLVDLPNGNPVPVVPGAPFRVHLSGFRDPAIWPSNERVQLDATLRALALDEVDWGALIPEDPEVITQAQYQALHARSESSAMDVAIAFDRDEVVVTPPPVPGRAIHVAVFAETPGDPFLHPWHRAFVTAEPPHP